MALRNVHRLPIPGEDLERIRSYLSPQYGSDVWEDGTSRVLLIRVPHEEPDIVNDVEDAVEYLSPGDVRDLTHCLLLGNRRIHAVYVQPVQDLMDARVRFDKAECIRIRPTLAPGEYAVYRSDDDPRRLWRLAVRIDARSVRDLDDAHIDPLVEQIGPELDAPRMRAVRAVYLIADEDDVRLDPDLFLQDLKQRFEDVDRRRRIAEEAARRAQEERDRKEAERRRIVREVERRIQGARRIVHAPMRHLEREGTWDAPRPPARTERSTRGAVMPASAAVGLASEEDVAGAARAMRSGMEDIRRRVEALGNGVDRQEEKISGPGRPAGWNRLYGALKTAGYDLLVEPPIPKGPAVHIAAERSRGYPQRIIARFLDRLTVSAVEEALEQARTLDVDLVLLVAPEADSVAEERLIATKVRYLHPDRAATFQP